MCHISAKSFSDVFWVLNPFWTIKTYELRIYSGFLAQILLKFIAG